MRILGNQGIRILGNWEIAKLGFWLLVFVWSFGFGAWNFAYAGTWPDFSNEGNGSWVSGYYRPITVTNSTASALTDYQVAITLTTAALGNPYTHIKADGSDLRFAASPPPNSGNELSYWIENWFNGDVNIVPNPSFSQGNYFWNSPQGNMFIDTTFGRTDSFSWKSTYTTPVGCVSSMINGTGGSTVTVSCWMYSTGNTGRFGIDTYDAAGTLLLNSDTYSVGGTGPGGYGSGIVNAWVFISGSWALPANASQIDIRFVSGEGTPTAGTAVFWDDVTITACGTSKIWVKAPSLPIGNSYLYMYYGNNSATAVSSGTNTFLLFDDFTSNTIGTKWTESLCEGGSTYPNTHTIQNGGYHIVQSPAGDSSACLTPNALPSNTTAQVTLSYTNWVGRNPPWSFFVIDFRGGNNYFLYAFGYWGGVQGGFNPSSPSDNLVLKWSDGATTNNVTIYRNGTLLTTQSVNFGTTHQPSFGLRTAASETIDAYYKNFFARKYASPDPAVSGAGAEVQYTLTKYVQSANWTSIVKAANKVTMGDNIAVISFTAVAAGTITTAHWRRFRIDETGGQPVSKLTVSVYEESGNDGFFDAADKFIASGTFNSNRTCYLNINRWPIGTTPKTYYIVEKVALDGSGGQTIRLNIVDGSYFDFEEGPCVGVPP